MPLSLMLSLLDWLSSLVRQRAAPALRLRADFDFPTTVEGNLPMSFRIATNQQITLHLTAADRAQHAAPVENPVWALGGTSAGLADLEPSADGFSATVRAKGTAGTVVGEVRADSRIGEGVNLLVGTFEIEIVPLEASQLIITADEPADIEAAPTPERPQPEPQPADPATPAAL